jgi:GntR family transcriptional regulator, frlABCD operon transcriptional regulator
MELEQNSTLLYMKVKKLIETDINSGRFPNNSYLPNEQQLCERYGVSRITLRRSITELEKENTVMKQQGKGTLVLKHDKYVSQLLDVDGLSETYQTMKSLHKHTKVLSKEIIKATGEVSKWLSIKEGSEVIELKRIVFISDVPESLDTAWFPLDLYPDLFPRLADDVSTFEIIKNIYGYKFEKVYKELSATVTLSDESKLLQCPIGTPVFFFKKKLSDENNRPIHFSKFLVKSDDIVYTLSLDYSKVGIIDNSK